MKNSCNIRPPAKVERAFTASRGRAVQSGFTLVELIAVLVIIGAVIAFVFPRLFGLGGVNLKSDSNRVSDLISYINESAITRKAYYRVWFDLGGGKLRVESSSDGVNFVYETESALQELSLSRGVEMADVVLPALGKVESGDASFVFPPGGARDAFTMHLESGEDAMTLYFDPITGKVITEEGYLYFGMGAHIFESGGEDMEI